MVRSGITELGLLGPGLLVSDQLTVLSLCSHVFSPGELGASQIQKRVSVNAAEAVQPIRREHTVNMVTGNAVLAADKLPRC